MDPNPGKYGMTDWQIGGVVSPGFEPVRKVFEENFAHHREVGAAVSVYHDGRPVVDLWGGWVDQRHNVPWAEDSLGLILSATKGLTTVCALHLADEGLLDPDAPVVEYWSEFGANGKERVTVRDLLTHQAGLPGFSRLMTFADMEAWEPLVEDLAAQAPSWEPGTAHGYHAYTFGLGFMLPGSLQSAGWGEGAFGHPGNGGSVGFADPNHGIAFGYCLKRIMPLSRYVRAERLIEATYECL